MIKHFISYIPEVDEDGEPTDDMEPCLFLHVPGRFHKRKAFGIALGVAYKYTADTYLIQQAQKACVHLGLGDSWHATRGMCDAIMHGMDSLIQAAEYELIKHNLHPGDRVACGEIKAFVDEELVSEHLVH